MDKEYYELFKKGLREKYRRNADILNIVEDAEKVDAYGESRIALENMIENILESGLNLSTEMIDIADRAFGDNRSDYDNKLIANLKKI